MYIGKMMWRLNSSPFKYSEWNIMLYTYQGILSIHQGMSREPMSPHSGAYVLQMYVRTYRLPQSHATQPVHNSWIPYLSIVKGANPSQSVVCDVDVE